MWGPNTLPHISSLTFPYISPYLPHTPTHFPTPPLIPLPTSFLTPQHIFLLSPHLPSPSHSVAKLPCDEVSVVKLPCGNVTEAKLLWRREVWGPNTLPHISSLTFPYISPYLPHTPTHFPTPSLMLLPTSSFPPLTPQHIFLLSPHLPSPSRSVAKLPCGEVSVAKLLATQ